MSELKRLKKTWITSAHRGFVRDGIASNTLPAYRLAAERGADMIEIDARRTRDGVQIVNHDPEACGYNKDGEKLSLKVSKTDYSELLSLRLLPNGNEECRVPTLSEALDVAYFSGMSINIDLKEGILYAEEIAKAVASHGMRGRTVYALNGAGAAAIRIIEKIDPDARFIDTKENFTKEKLSEIPGYPAKCFVYTSDFSEENIAEIRKSGCMLAAISLNEENAFKAFSHNPDMAEYPHTSDFATIDKMVAKMKGFFYD